MIATITGSVKNDRMLFDDLSKALDDRKYAREKLDDVKKTLQAFVYAPKIERKRIIKAFGVSTDFDQLTKNAFNITIEEENFDLGYEAAFRTVPLSPGDLGWEIYTVYNGLAFQKVEEGGRIEINKLSGDKVSVECDYYGGALGFTDKMIRGRKIPAMIDMAMEFRASYWSNKADNHYVLVDAAALNTTPYQGDPAEGQLRRDVQTINLAAYTLAFRCKDKGYGDTANTVVVAYVNLRDKPRFQAALNVTTNSLNPALGIGDEVNYTIRPIYTLNSNIKAGSPVFCLPGHKAQKADAMLPTTYTPGGADPLTLNQYQAVWSIYAAAIADTDQFQKATLG